MPRQSVTARTRSMLCALAALGALGAGGAARAQDGIYDVVINFSSLGSTSPNDSEVSTDFEIGSDAVAGPNQSFTSRYGFNVNADSKSVSRSKMASAIHEVRFEVRSTRGYSLRISTGWVGQMIRQADTLSCADAVILSGVTGEVVGGFGLSSGSLSLSDPPDITLQTSGDESVELSEVADAVITVANPSAVESHVLRFSWEGGVLSDTCEVAVRLGGSSGSTTECETCRYPGDPPRDQSFDGHFVNVQYEPSNCGNGQVDSGEQCDLGEGNGFGACCDIFCRLEPEQMPCSDGLFCNGDGRCSATGVCVELGDPCAALPECAVCDEASDMCLPCAPTATPTLTPAATGTATPVGTAATTPAATVTATSAATPSPTPPAGTATATPVETVSPTPSASASAGPDCAGDCNGDGRVIINELIQAVRIALGNSAVTACAAADTDRSGDLAINELIQAVGAALAGCG